MASSSEILVLYICNIAEQIHLLSTRIFPTDHKNLCLAAKQHLPLETAKEQLSYPIEHCEMVYAREIVAKLAPQLLGRWRHLPVFRLLDLYNLYNREIYLIQQIVTIFPQVGQFRQIPAWFKYGVYHYRKCQWRSLPDFSQEPKFRLPTARQYKQRMEKRARRMRKRKPIGSS